MMCRRLIRESGTSESHRKWTLPSKLLFPRHTGFTCISCCRFRSATACEMKIIACVDREVVFLGFLLPFFDDIIGSESLRRFIFVLFWSMSRVFVDGGLARSDPQASGVSLIFAPYFVAGEKMFRNFSQWIAGEFIGGWLAITD